MLTVWSAAAILSPNAARSKRHSRRKLLLLLDRQSLLRRAISLENRQHSLMGWLHTQHPGLLAWCSSTTARGLGVASILGPVECEYKFHLGIPSREASVGSSSAAGNLLPVVCAQQSLVFNPPPARTAL